MTCLLSTSLDLSAKVETCQKDVDCEVDSVDYADLDISIAEQMQAASQWLGVVDEEKSPRHDVPFAEQMRGLAIVEEIEMCLSEQHKRLISTIRTLILQPQSFTFDPAVSKSRQATPDNSESGRQTRRWKTNADRPSIGEPMHHVASHRSTAGGAMKAAADFVANMQLSKGDRMLKKVLGGTRELSVSTRLSDSTQTTLATLSKSVSAVSLADDDSDEGKRGGGSLQSFLRSPFFELTMGILVFVNAVFIGCEVDYIAHHPGETSIPLEFNTISYFFTVAFIIELILRLVSNWYEFLWDDRFNVLVWNYLDIFIVISSIVEVGFDVIASNHTGQVNLSNLRVVRVIRVFRLIRLFRVARFVRFVRALRMMVYSVLCTLKDVFWAMILLATIMYISSILFTSAATSHITQRLVESETEIIPNLEKHWGSLDNSMRSLFMSVSGGISWNEVFEPLTQVDPVWSYFFLVFISFTYFAVLNVVTGVFCQASAQATNEDQDSMLQVFLRHKQIYIDRFVGLFQDLDENNEGVIRLDDYVAKMGDEEVRNFFAALDLDSVDAISIFDLFDDASTNGVRIEEFVMGCLKLKGTARSSDMIRLLHEQRLLMDRVGYICDHFQIAIKRKNTSAINVQDKFVLDAFTEAIQKQVTTMPSREKPGMKRAHSMKRKE